MVAGLNEAVVLLTTPSVVVDRASAVRHEHQCLADLDRVTLHELTVRDVLHLDRDDEPLVVPGRVCLVERDLHHIIPGEVVARLNQAEIGIVVDLLRLVVVTAGFVGAVLLADQMPGADLAAVLPVAGGAVELTSVQLLMAHSVSQW